MRPEFMFLYLLLLPMKSLQRTNFLTVSNAVTVLFSGHSTREHALLYTNVKHRTIVTGTPQDCLITQVSLFGGRIRKVPTVC